MAWPTNKPDSNRFQLPESSIALSRPELKIMSDAVNDIVDFIDTTGISNGYILQYNSTSGKLEAVANPNSETNILAGEGITITKDDSAGQHEVAFSGQYTANGNTTYTFQDTQLAINTAYSTPTIQSTNSAAPGLYLKAGVNHLASIYFDGNQNGFIKITPHGTGKVRINDAYNLPNADGTSGQVIQTDGSGNLTFANVSGGGSVSPLTADLETGGYNIVGSNGKLGLYVDQNDSVGGGIEIGGPIYHAFIDSDGNEFHGSGQLTIVPGPSIGNTQIMLKEGTGNQTVYVRGTDGVEINRINIPDAISQSASVGQVLRVSSVGNPGVFNANDVVNLEFATISGGAGGDTQIEAAPTGNITVTQPDSGGAFTISLAEPLNNPIDANNQAISHAVFRGYSEHVYTGMSTSGAITPDVNDGNVAVITLSGNITINSFMTPATGDSMTIIIKQPASGGPYTLSSTMKFAGGNKTLSTTAGAIDVLSMFWDGTDMIASLSTNFN